MDVRRVVTGKNAQGKSIFVSDGRIETIAPSLTPGAEFHTIWGADIVPQLPQDGTEPAHPQYFPGPGGYRVGFFTLAPANAPAPTVTDMNAAFAEFEQKVPGLLGRTHGAGCPGHAHDRHGGHRSRDLG